jgi:c-di-GMP-binding flagellar brake protein YcgR
MDADIGTKMLLEFPTSGERLAASLVGLEALDYFILKVPLTIGIRHFLHPGNQITLRYVHRGRVHGFRAGVIEYLVKPFSLLFLTYPTSMETVELRRDHRVECFFPAKLSLDQAVIKGMLLDISTSGCKVQVDAERIPNARQLLTPRAALGVSFHALDPKASYDLAGSVRSVSDATGRMHLGLRFTDSAGAVIEAIAAYVREVSASLAPDPSAPPDAIRP